MWRRHDRALLVAACVAVFASRLPWLFAGPGVDPDAYRVLRTARHIAETGEYAYSRAPGYPVHEYAVAAIVELGAGVTVSNALTAALSALAFLFFALILRRYRVPSYGLVALAFAFAPVVYLHSTTTMDYLWAISFVLGSAYFALSRRPILAGIFLGVAIGCRITSGAMLLPIALLLAASEPSGARVRPVAILAGVSVGVGALCFVPVLLAYGPAFFKFYDQKEYLPLDLVAERASFEVWGSLGIAALAAWAVTIAVSYRRVREAVSRSLVRWTLIACAAAIILYLIAYLRLPHDAAYLIPLVPFVLLALALLTPRWPLRVFAATLMLSPFASFREDERGFDGTMAAHHERRVAGTELSRSIIAAVERLPGKAAVVVGTRLPGIEALVDTRRGPHRYVYLIEDEAHYKRLHEAGYELYYAPAMEKYNQRAHGIDIRALGAQRLDIGRR